MALSSIHYENKTKTLRITDIKDSKKGLRITAIKDSKRQNIRQNQIKQRALITNKSQCLSIFSLEYNEIVKTASDEK